MSNMTFDLEKFIQGMQSGRDELDTAIRVAHIEGQIDDPDQLIKWMNLVVKNAIENILRKKFPANYEAQTKVALELLENYSWDEPESIVECDTDGSIILHVDSKDLDSIAEDLENTVEELGDY